jgi:eukaryotic-like serine/threonine-protein kinase
VRIGNYEILAKLGVGGMAEVLLGRAAAEGGFEKLVAIKRVLPSQALRPPFVEMFLDEARIAAKLSHSNIVQIFELGRSEDTYFIAMEYVPGLSLSGLIRYGNENDLRVSGPLAAFIGMGICHGLEHAHTMTDAEGVPLSIIHRDVSPSNVLLSFEGDVKLIDFGIARASQRLHATETGFLKGKEGYIAPELLRGAQATVRSDVFAAGMVLYVLLTNRNPYSEAPRLQGHPAPPPSQLVDDVPAELEVICRRAIDLDPAARFPSAGAMGSALELYWHHNPFNRQSLAAWLKRTFRDRYEQQQRLSGRSAAPAGRDEQPTASAVIVNRTRADRPIHPDPGTSSDAPTRRRPIAPQINAPAEAPTVIERVAQQQAAVPAARRPRRSALVVVGLLLVAGMLGVVLWLTRTSTPGDPPEPPPRPVVEPTPVSEPVPSTQPIPVARSGDAALPSAPPESTTDLGPKQAAGGRPRSRALRRKTTQSAPAPRPKPQPQPKLPYEDI